MMYQYIKDNINKNKISFIFIFLFCFLISNAFVAHAQYNYTNSYSTSSSSISSAIINNSISTSTASSSEKIKYIMIRTSCKYNFVGTCVKIREEPTIKSKIIVRARAGMVLRVDTLVTNDIGEKWYKIKFTEKLTYTERISDIKGYYVRADLVEPLHDMHAIVYSEDDIINDNKRIIVDISEQRLYAYENNKVLYKMKVSTGLTDTPTAADEYYITYKTPSRYMQGPNKENLEIENKKIISNANLTFASTTINKNNATASASLATRTRLYTATSTDVKGYYDLPGVPYVMYFSEDGSAIHGAYWHNNFGRHHSHGCVNLSISDSEKLYKWAESGTSVIIRK